MVEALLFSFSPHYQSPTRKRLLDSMMSLKTRSLRRFSLAKASRSPVSAASARHPSCRGFFTDAYQVGVRSSFEGDEG